MTRFIFWAFTVGLAIGYGPKFFTAMLTMAKSAIHAHQHDQMSYSKFTKKLLNAKPRASHTD